MSFSTVLRFVVRAINSRDHIVWWSSLRAVRHWVLLFSFLLRINRVQSVRMMSLVILSSC